MQTPNSEQFDTQHYGKRSLQEIRNRIFELTDITPKRTKDRPSPHSENVLHWREIAPYILGATFGGLELLMWNEMLEVRCVYRGQNILLLSFKVDLTLKAAIQANASKYNNETIDMKDSFLDSLFKEDLPGVPDENEG